MGDLILQGANAKRLQAAVFQGSENRENFLNASSQNVFQRQFLQCRKMAPKQNHSALMPISLSHSKAAICCLLASQTAASVTFDPCGYIKPRIWTLSSKHIAEIRRGVLYLRGGSHLCGY